MSQTTGFTRRLPVCTGGSPGHQRHGPAGWSSGQPGQDCGAGPGWASVVPAPITPATPPHSSTVVANPTISRFINLGLSSAAASRVLGILVKRGFGCRCCRPRVARSRKVATGPLGKCSALARRARRRPRPIAPAGAVGRGFDDATRRHRWVSTAGLVEWGSWFESDWGTRNPRWMHCVRHFYTGEPVSSVTGCHISPETG